MTEEKAQPKEQPVLETPEEENNEPSPEDRAAELLRALDGLGLDTAEKIQSTAQASSQAGNLANLLGEERKRAHELEQRLAQIEQQQRRPAQQDYYYEEPQTSQSASLTPDAIKAAVRDVVGEYVQTQQQAQMATAQEFSRIQSDPDFPAVRSIWERHLQNPNVQLALQSGQTSLNDQYQNVRTGYYKELLMQARDTVKGYTQKVAASPPHVEQNTTSAVPSEPKPRPRDDLLNIASQSTGDENTIDDMLKVLLPDNDAIFVPERPK